MVNLSPEVLQSRAEHNEKNLATLEEISLNSLSIERIESIGRHCRSLRILHLSDNAITQIENLHMLKDLEYLNMAMNCVSLIPSLETNEMLTKIDLTLNFIGDLRASIGALRGNLRLKDLYLVGNPCADYKDYRDYVIGSLPQLKTLDGRAIQRDERILARQRLAEIDGRILDEEAKYAAKRSTEMLIHEESIQKNLKYYMDESLPLLERREAYYKSSSLHSPEYRLEQCRLKEYFEAQDEKERNPPEPKKLPRRLMNDDGEPLNVNEIKWDFQYDDKDPRNVLIHIGIPKHIDTRSLDCLIEPTYIRITYNRKVLQLRLLEEIKTSNSKVERSLATGSLVLSLPRLSTISSSAAYFTQPPAVKPFNQGQLCINDSYHIPVPGRKNRSKEESSLHLPPSLILEEE